MMRHDFVVRLVNVLLLERRQVTTARDLVGPHKDTYQSSKLKIAVGRNAGFARRSDGRHAHCIAGRKDHGKSDSRLHSATVRHGLVRQ